MCEFRQPACHVLHMNGRRRVLQQKRTMREMDFEYNMSALLRIGNSTLPQKCRYSTEYCPRREERIQRGTRR